VTLLMQVKTDINGNDDPANLNLGGESVIADNHAKDITDVKLTVPEVKLGQSAPTGQNIVKEYFLEQIIPIPLTSLQKLNIAYP